MFEFWCRTDSGYGSRIFPTFYGQIKTAEQWTIIQRYGDWYIGRWWMGCYIWHSEEGPGWARAPPRPLLAVPNVTVHPSTVGCYVCYNEEGPGRASAPLRPLLAVPNVAAHLPTTSVPTSYYSMRHYNCLWTLNCWHNEVDHSTIFSSIGHAVTGRCIFTKLSVEITDTTMHLATNQPTNQRHHRASQ